MRMYGKPCPKRLMNTCASIRLALVMGSSISNDMVTIKGVASAAPFFSNNFCFDKTKFNERTSNTTKVEPWRLLKYSQKYGKILVRMFENPQQISNILLLWKRGLDSVSLIKILEILFFRMGGFLCVGLLRHQH